MRNASSILRVRQELIQARRVKPGACVCAHTRPPRPRLLTELTCLELVYSACGFAGPRHDNTLFSKPKVPARARARERCRALCKLSGLPGVSIIARGRYLPFVPFNRIRQEQSRICSFDTNSKRATTYLGILCYEIEIKIKFLFDVISPVRN